MTTTWHADPAALAAYVEGSLDDVRASSLEAHLLTCDRCREGIATSTAADAIDHVWGSIVDTIDTPHRSAVERLLLALRVPEHLARLLVATPSLRLSWLVAEALALGFAVIAANGTSGQDEELVLFLFLVVAALLPVAGVAVAFGPGIDPTYEVAAAAPMPADRLLLIRAAAVLASSVSITALAALALPDLDAIAAAWLLPALGLTAATLALGTWVRPLVAAASVALTWVLFAAAAAVSTQDRLAAFRPAGQVACLAVIAASAAVLAHRHTLSEGRIVR
ncbi:MAG: zf-HC2 domain-containing protein [Actinomycetota bacterium]